jgi:DNA-binding MarR family transcriptional regulator
MQSNRPQQDDEMSLPHLILDALPVTMRVLAAQMRDTPHNLHSGHLPALAALTQQPHTQSALAEMMSVSGATMSNTLTALEERGWIARERSHEDRRVVHISLTSAGKTAFDETMIQMERYIEGLLTHLDERQRAELRTGLLRLREVFYRALGDESP